MVMLPDVEIRGIVDRNGGFAYMSVRQLRDISGKRRTGRLVAELISDDISGAGLSHLPFRIPKDQNRSVLVWYNDPSGQADAPISTAAPYLDAIFKLAMGGQGDVDEATVQRLADHTRHLVAATIGRADALVASGERG
ncbi:hypothetical protein PV342_12410 [Streptomyces sp. PA03-3a]|nr:hypothetical protein [Streptomyces sp. PA03-3a]